MVQKSPYAASKVSGEVFVQAFANLYGYRPVILRLFNVYGPKQLRAYADVIIEFIGEFPKVNHQSFLAVVSKRGTSCMSAMLSMQ